MKECFVMMPFNGQYDDLYDHVIKPALEDIDVKAVRVDRVAGANYPFEKIHQCIKNSFFCIAEVTDENPNVMYEIGYATASERKTIVLWNQAKKNKPSFDIQHFMGEPYNNEQDNTWSAKLANRIKQHGKAELISTNTKRNTNEEKTIAVTSNELSEIELTILAVLLKADSKHQKIGVKSFIHLLSELGLDSVKATLSLKTMTDKKIIFRTFNTNGDIVCYYHLVPKSNELITSNYEKIEPLLAKIPDNLSYWAPNSRTSWA